jgi:aconitate hydratase
VGGVSKLAPRAKLRVQARNDGGKEKTFEVVARADTPEEVAYYRNGGILPYVLRQML